MVVEIYSHPYHRRRINITYSAREVRASKFMAVFNDLSLCCCAAQLCFLRFSPIIYANFIYYLFRITQLGRRFYCLIILWFSIFLNLSILFDLLLLTLALFLIVQIIVYFVFLYQLTLINTKIF